MSTDQADLTNASGLSNNMYSTSTEEHCSLSRSQGRGPIQDQSFLSVSGYWIHQHYLRAPIHQIDEHTQCQDRYAFVSTSRTEDGDKDQAMTVRTCKVYRHTSGQQWTEQKPYWRVSRTVAQGRKLYQQLLANGYRKDTELL